MERVINFYPGPATLPLSVLEKLQKDLVNFHGHGLSLLETSHRSSEYDAVHNRAVELVTELLGLGEEHTVLLLGGGATLQFAMAPMNLLRENESGDYIVSGSWSKKAVEDARIVGKASVVFDGKESGYTTLPDAVTPSQDARYVYLCSNETIGGVQWKQFPRVDKPLVADMSSDLMSRRFDPKPFGVFFACAQKNLGPAGVTVVVVRKDVLAEAPEKLPAYLSYAIHADKNSLYNTPPVFPVWALAETLAWQKDQGGLDAIEKRNEAKARALYDAIDESNGFYTCPADSKYRSTMNVVFTLPSKELEAAFLEGTKAQGMVGLKGHRSVGGCRASLYNALPLDAAERLAEFMQAFREKN
jgi:phosphoserine aminotransferase